MNSLGGGVFETRRRFQIASPASMSPALRPMRGSGDGAVAPGGMGAVGVLVDALQPAAIGTITARVNARINHTSPELHRCEVVVAVMRFLFESGFENTITVGCAVTRSTFSASG